MKQKLVTILLITLIHYTFFCQNNTAYYGEEYTQMIIDTSKIANDQVKSVILSQQMTLKNALSGDIIIYQLNFNKNKAKFFPFDRLESDFNPNLQKAIKKGEYYTDISNNTSVRKLNAFNDTYHIENNKVYWNITSEKKIIKNIKCHKAIGKISDDSREIVAWFAPELPFSFGPIGYYGLPGLIVELYDKERKYYLKEIKIKDKNSHKDINLPSRNLYISEEEFNSMLCSTHKCNTLIF